MLNLLNAIAVPLSRGSPGLEAGYGGNAGVVNRRVQKPSSGMPDDGALARCRRFYQDIFSSVPR